MLALKSDVNHLSNQIRWIGKQMAMLLFLSAANSDHRGACFDQNKTNFLIFMFALVLTWKRFFFRAGSGRLPYAAAATLLHSGITCHSQDYLFIK